MKVLREAMGVGGEGKGLVMVDMREVEETAEGWKVLEEARGSR